MTAVWLFWLFVAKLLNAHTMAVQSNECLWRINNTYTGIKKKKTQQTIRTRTTNLNETVPFLVILAVQSGLSLLWTYITAHEVKWSVIKLLWFCRNSVAVKNNIRIVLSSKFRLILSRSAVSPSWEPVPAPVETNKKWNKRQPTENGNVTCHNFLVTKSFSISLQQSTIMFSKGGLRGLCARARVCVRACACVYVRGRMCVRVRVHVPGHFLYLQYAMPHTSTNRNIPYLSMTGK